MAKIFILRHGKADHNLGTEKQNTFAGLSIDNGLAPEGAETANNLVGLIRMEGGCDLVVASKLKRSQETATIIARYFNVPVETIANLEEIDVGDFAGHTEEEVRQLYPEATEAFYGGDIQKWSFPHGENYEAVVQRIESVISQLKVLAREYQTIAVVGHGMFNRVWFYKFLPKRKDLWAKRSYPHDRIVSVNVNF